MLTQMQYFHRLSRTGSVVLAAITSISTYNVKFPSLTCPLVLSTCARVQYKFAQIRRRSDVDPRRVCLRPCSVRLSVFKRCELHFVKLLEQQGDSYLYNTVYSSYPNEIQPPIHTTTLLPRCLSRLLFLMAMATQHLSHSVSFLWLHSSKELSLPPSERRPVSLIHMPTQQSNKRRPTRMPTSSTALNEHTAIY